MTERDFADQAVLVLQRPLALGKSLRRRHSQQIRPALIIGAIGLAAIVTLALVGPLVAPYNPTQQSLHDTLGPPGQLHMFGTDNYGRDIFSRVLFAIGIDLQIGLIGVLLPWIIGVLLGLLAGFIGGVADIVIMRVLDTVTAFPFLVLVIGIIAILGPGLVNMYVGLTLVG